MHGVHNCAELGIKQIVSMGQCAAACTSQQLSLVHLLCTEACRGWPGRTTTCR